MMDSGFRRNDGSNLDVLSRFFRNISAHPLIRSSALLALGLCLLPLRPAHATNITVGPSLSNTNITSELNNTTNGTTVQFTLDVGGQVEVAFYQVSPVDSSLTLVTAININPASGGAQSVFWNALWPIGIDFGRHDGTFAYQVIPATGTAEPPTGAQSSNFTINSVDIHNLTVTPSFDSNQQPTFPYKISYALAKQANVTVQIYNSSNTLVRTVFTGQQPDETVSSTTVTWDGLKTDGTPAPIGIYISSVTASDPDTKAQAIARTRSFGVSSLAGAAVDAQKLFESNVYVYPNPVRNGQAWFNVLPVRDGAIIHLRIYTITGTLVLDQDITADITAQRPFRWNVTNQSGNKLGRGLYYYVVREDDAQGTLQVTKKMAVLP